MIIDKRANNDLQSNTQNIKERANRTRLKAGGELRCSGRVSNSCSTSGAHRVTVPMNSQTLHERPSDVYSVCECIDNVYTRMN
jgi:hypothetical protein